MEGFLKVLIFLGLAVAFTKAAVTVYAQPDTNAHFLGTVDGKSYFADDTITRDWSASKAYCESIGMTLASVRTTAERDFFAGIDDPGFQNVYWIAGRDARTPLQFSWDDDGEPLSAVSTPFYFFHEDPLTCVGHDSRWNSVSNKRFESRPCNFTYGAICESHNLCGPPARH